MFGNRSPYLIPGVHTMVSNKSRVLSRHLRSTRRAVSAVAGALVVVMFVDPFGLSAVSASAQPLESRSEAFDDAVEALGLDAPMAAVELTGSWDALPDGGAIPTVPADLPVADEELVALSEEPAGGGALAFFAPDRFPTEVLPPAAPGPVEVDLGGLDVIVAPSESTDSPSSVLLRVAGEAETNAANITGVLLDVTDASAAPVADPEVSLTVSYATFAGLGSGDWAARLQFVWVPDCNNVGESCVPVPIATENNLSEQTVTATVPVDSAPEVTTSALASFSRSTSSILTSGGGGGGSVAITAGSSGSAGDWGATSLSPSSSWGNSGSTGAFTWSLPITVTAAAAGPAPQLAFSYSSATSDGRTPSTNNQSGTVGEGFAITEGFVERSYTPCSQDETGAANNIGRISGDLCWGTENATIDRKSVV